MRSPWRPIAASSVLLLLAGPSRGQVTTRVSVDSRGVQGNGQSDGVCISADGRYIAFTSYATDLVPGDTNGMPDVFVRDRRSGTTERVSVGTGGFQGNDESWLGGMSADGRYVVFSSYSTNLFAGDTNGASDAFVHDRVTGATELLSVDSRGVLGNDSTYGGPLSDDGRFVTLISFASNLVPGDTNGVADVFVRDRVLGVTERVSVSSTGEQAAPGFDDETSCAISADGRFVAFVSDAGNLVPGDTNADPDVFVRDRLLATTERVSVSSTGSQQNYDSGYEGLFCAISADGRSVIFNSIAADLVPGDTNGVFDLFLHDRLTGTTERIDVSSRGEQADQGAFWAVASVTGDDRYVAFVSAATNLVPDDTNGHPDVFLRDRVAGTTERVNLRWDGAPTNGWSYPDWEPPAISRNARFIAFASSADDLVPDDTNRQTDIFVRDRFGSPTFESACVPSGGGVPGCPCANPPSGRDRGCDNSAGTGGAVLSAEGGTFLSSDSLEFRVAGVPPNALSLLLQGTDPLSGGVFYGQGVRCVGGSIRRLYAKSAESSSVLVPDFAAGDAPISARSSALGDQIRSGEQRWYQVIYRDPVVLGGCPTTSTFNATQAGVVTWLP